MSERIAVGISGRGRSLNNLLSKQHDLAYEAGGVFCSRPNAEGLKFAQQLPSAVFDFTQEQSMVDLCRWLKQHDLHGIVLAGFTRHFPVLEGYEDRQISIHPSLLPKFGGRGMFGKHVHRAVFNAGEKTSGATVHLVTEEFDEGRIIAQIGVDISSCASVEAVQDKVFDAECWVYPQVVDYLVRNDWQELPPLQYQQHGDSYQSVEDLYAKCS